MHPKELLFPPYVKPAMAVDTHLDVRFALRYVTATNLIGPEKYMIHVNN